MDPYTPYVGVEGVNEPRTPDADSRICSIDGQDGGEHCITKEGKIFQKNVYGQFSIWQPLDMKEEDGLEDCEAKRNNEKLALDDAVQQEKIEKKKKKAAEARKR
jgi:hypothetical protein